MCFEDSHFESEHLRAIHSAMLNILDDADAGQEAAWATERAVVNILGDAERDKERLNLTQKSMLNILGMILAPNGTNCGWSSEPASIFWRILTKKGKCALLQNCRFDI